MKSCAAGFTEWLLFHIWKPNPSTKISCIDVLVPETVIYRLGKPFFWYFTLPTGEILRKARSRVTHKYILQEFLANSSEILAYYLGFVNSSKANANSAVIEFFTEDSLVDFIHNRDKCKTGILQQWIEPKSGQNSLIKVQWSQQFCLIERRINKFKIDDNKVDFYDKLVTYEGMQYNSCLEPVTAPWIIAEIQKICLGIASHVTVVTGGNVTVTRMVLFFKQDKYDKLWLMYCSALKVMDISVPQFEIAMKWQELEVVVPDNIVLKKLPLEAKGFEVKKNRALCVGCNFLTKTKNMYDISLSSLVKAFIKGKNLPQQGESVRGDITEIEEKYDLVPRIVRRMNKKITNQKYKEMQNDPTWDTLQVKVCEDCFLHFTRPRSVKRKKNKPKISESRSITPPLLTELKRNQSEKVVLNIKPLPLIKNKQRFDMLKIESSLATPTDNVLQNSFILKAPVPPESALQMSVVRKVMIPSDNHSQNSFLKRTPANPYDILQKSELNQLPQSHDVTNVIRKFERLPSVAAKPKLMKYIIESSSKNAIPIYGKISLTPNKRQASSISTSFSRGNITTTSESDFIQDTLTLLKNSINKLSS